MGFEATQKDRLKASVHIPENMRSMNKLSLLAYSAKCEGLLAFRGSFCITAVDNCSAALLATPFEHTNCSNFDGHHPLAVYLS